MSESLSNIADRMHEVATAIDVDHAPFNHQAADMITTNIKVAIEAMTVDQFKSLSRETQDAINRAAEVARIVIPTSPDENLMKPDESETGYAHRLKVIEPLADLQRRFNSWRSGPEMKPLEDVAKEAVSLAAWLLLNWLQTISLDLSTVSDYYAGNADIAQSFIPAEP